MIDVSESSLIPYAEWAPTQFDRAGAFLDDDKQDWYVLPMSRTRDSGTLENSNFEHAVAALEECEEDYETHSFNHWGPGWVEIIIVKPGTKALEIGLGLAERLAEYPVLDEEDWSMREWEEAAEYWGNMSLSARVELLQDNDESVFAARCDSYWDLPERAPATAEEIRGYGN